MKTVVGMFSDVGEAQRTFEELTRSGFSPNDISVVTQAGKGIGDRMRLSAFDASDTGKITVGGPIGTALSQGKLGLIGTLTVLGLFVMVAYQGYRIAIKAPDTFSGLLAAGITTWLVVQACVNMMVVTALMPVTGIPLPFISYGGSALTLNLVAVGILLSISRETTQTGSLLDAVFGVGRRDRRARVPRAGRRAGPARRAARA